MTLPAKGQFGQWLREWRNANCCTLQRLSDKSGVSKVALLELEHGKRFNPKLSTLMAISKATGVAFARVAILAATQKMQASQLSK